MEKISFDEVMKSPEGSEFNYDHGSNANLFIRRVGEGISQVILYSNGAESVNRIYSHRPYKQHEYSVRTVMTPEKQEAFKEKIAHAKTIAEFQKLKEWAMTNSYPFSDAPDVGYIYKDELYGVINATIKRLAMEAH